MSKFANTALLKQQISLYRPEFGGKTAFGVARYPLCSVKPEFPTDDVKYEEIPNYCGGLDGVGDVERMPGTGKHKLVFERITYAELAMIFELALSGGQEPTDVGGLNTWVYSSVDQGDIAQLNAQLGVPVEDTFFVKGIANAVVEKLTIEGKSDKSYVTATLEIRGDETELYSFLSEADTNAVNSPYVKTKDIELFIDSSPGSIGTSQVSCSRLAFKITVQNGTDTAFTDCGAVSERSSRAVELELSFLLNKRAITSYSYYNHGITRFLQIKGSDADGDGQWIFNLASKYEDYKHGTGGPFQELTLVGKALHDATLGYSWQSSVGLNELDWVSAYGYLFDSFTDADETLLSVHTPEYGSYDSGGASYKISGNRMCYVSSGGPLLWNIGVAHCLVRLNVLWAGLGMTLQVFVRYQDSNNHWRVDLSVTKVEVYEVAGGTETLKSTFTYSPLATNINYVYEVKSTDGLIEVAMDGMVLGTTTATSFASEPQQGLNVPPFMYVDCLQVM